MEDTDFIKSEIETLDLEIERARKTMASIEKKNADAANDKVYKVLKAKITDWVSKRNFLLEQFVIKPLQNK